MSMVTGKGAVTCTALPVDTRPSAQRLPPFAERTATIGRMRPIGHELADKTELYQRFTHRRPFQ